MAEALDLIIAKKYADYTGKTIEEIFGLMGESKWLTAQEAKDWGFINEVLPGKMNKNSSAATNLFEAMGLPPVPEVKTDNTKEDTLVNRIVDGIKGIFKNDDTNHDKIINTVMNKEFLSVNKVLNIEGFEVADNKVTLTVEQMKIINTALTNAGQEIDQADNKYNGLLAKIDGLSDVVKNAADEDAKIEAIRDIVNKIPASVVNDNNGGNDNRTFNDVAVDPINRFDEE